MIQFVSLRVENFALYPYAEITFSRDENMPLTVIRGENESGKTTLMRAFVWSVFGARALPDIPEVRHPIRPVWLTDDEEIETSVKIRFDVSTDRGTSRYQLSRRAVTKEKEDAVEYGPEEVRLLQFDGDEWLEQDDHKIHVLQRNYFRPELQDFYFIDADKAVEFVGGPEGRHDESMMRKSTTQAVRSLLGLNVMKKASDRLETLRTEFSRQVGRLSSDKEQQALAKELANAEEQYQKAKIDLEETMKEKRNCKDKLEEAKRTLDSDLAAFEELEELNHGIEELESELKDHDSAKAQVTTDLGNVLHSAELHSALMISAIDSVKEELQPLKKKGVIPPSELELIPRLLSAGECICGTPLKKGSAPWKTLDEQLREQEKDADSSRYLASALDFVLTAKSSFSLGQGPRWHDGFRETLHEFGEIDGASRELQIRLEDLKEQRKDESSKSSTLRSQQQYLGDLERRFGRLESQAAEHANRKADFEAKKRSIEAKLRSADKAEARTRTVRYAAEIASDLRDLIHDAYDTIESEQVEDVSSTMNEIFRDVISATSDSLFAEVGVRPVEDGEYEPFAKDGGKDKPLALANGASRRALAVAFVLSLAEETRTQVPFVADSLLHAMSGTVKSKVVDYITSGDKIGQPILFGTRTDLLDAEVTELLKSRCGKSYTLTSQTHVGGDVVRAAQKAKFTKQVVVCECGIDEYCPVCERLDDAERAEQGRISPKEESRLVGY